MPPKENDFLKDPLARTLHLPPHPPTKRKNGRKSKSTAGQQSTLASATTHKAVVEIPLRYEDGLSLQQKSRLSVRTSFPVYTTTRTNGARQEVNCALNGISAMRGRTGYTTGSAELRLSHHQDPTKKGRCTTLSACLGAQQLPISTIASTETSSSPTFIPSAAPILHVGITTSKPKTSSLIAANVSLPPSSTIITESSKILTSLSVSKVTKLLNNNKRGLRPLQLRTQCSIAAHPTVKSSLFRSSNFGVSLTPAAPKSAKSSNEQPSWTLRLGWNKQRKKKACPLIGLSISMWLPSIKALCCSRKLLDLSVLRKGAGSWQVTGMWTQRAALKDVEKAAPSRRIGVGVNLSGKIIANKPGILSWIFSWTEGDVTLRVPIVLTPSAAVASAIYYEQAMQFVVLSFVSGIIQDVVGRVFVSSSAAGHEERQTQTSGNQKREIARQEALQQQSLMKRQATLRMEAERERDGLVITRATYSIRRDSGQGDNDEDSLDVTIPLQFWVNDSKLELFEAAKRGSMLGFYNIAQIPRSKEVAVTRTASDTSHLSDSFGNNDLGWSSKWKTRFWSLWFESEDGDSRQSYQPQQVAELKVWYDFSGNSYEISIADEEEITLPCARAKLIL